MAALLLSAAQALDGPLEASPLTAVVPTSTPLPTATAHPHSPTEASNPSARSNGTGLRAGNVTADANGTPSVDRRTSHAQKMGDSGYGESLFAQLSQAASSLTTPVFARPKVVGMDEVADGDTTNTEEAHGQDMEPLREYERATQPKRNLRHVSLKTFLLCAEEVGFEDIVQPVTCPREECEHSIHLKFSDVGWASNSFDDSLDNYEPDIRLVMQSCNKSRQGRKCNGRFAVPDWWDGPTIDYSTLDLKLKRHGMVARGEEKPEKQVEADRMRKTGTGRGRGRGASRCGKKFSGQTESVVSNAPLATDGPPTMDTFFNLPDESDDEQDPNDVRDDTQPHLDPMDTSDIRPGLSLIPPAPPPPPAPRRPVEPRGRVRRINSLPEPTFHSYLAVRAPRTRSPSTTARRLASPGRAGPYTLVVPFTNPSDAFASLRPSLPSPGTASTFDEVLTEMLAQPPPLRHLDPAGLPPSAASRPPLHPEHTFHRVLSELVASPPPLRQAPAPSSTSVAADPLTMVLSELVQRPPNLRNTTPRLVPAHRGPAQYGLVLREMMTRPPALRGAGGSDVAPQPQMHAWLVPLGPDGQPLPGSIPTAPPRPPTPSTRTARHRRTPSTASTRSTRSVASVSSTSTATTTRGRPSSSNGSRPGSTYDPLDPFTHLNLAQSPSLVASGLTAPLPGEDSMQGVTSTAGGVPDIFLVQPPAAGLYGDGQPPGCEDIEMELDHMVREMADEGGREEREWMEQR